MIFISCYPLNTIDNIVLKNKKSIIKFCKKHPNEIICYLNKDTSEEKEILNRYIELNAPFVISKEYSTILEKYKKDKVRIYDPCYIGTSETIIAYHRGKLKNIVYENIFNQEKKLVSVSFLTEIILSMIFCLILILKRSIISILFCLFLFLIFIEYELDIKHLDISIVNKIIYLLIDGIHISIVFFTIYLLFHFFIFRNIKKLILLNIVSFILILFFCIHKQCILTIINNNITNRYTIWKGSFDRLQYFFHLNRPYVNNTIYKKDEINDFWLSDNKYFIGILILLNFYALS
jgi:hypothetical protein